MKAQPQSNRNVIVRGISFQPHIWERLEAEVEKQERPNRSLIVERALKDYLGMNAEAQQSEPTTEGAA